MAKRIGICTNCNTLNRFDDEKSSAVCGSCKQPLSIDTPYQNVSSRQLQELIAKSPVPVVVDFWAAWCGPCRAFAPTFESVARQMNQEFVFVKLDTEHQPEAANAHGIRGIPTVAMFAGGQEKSRQSGAMPQPMFVQWLKSNV